MALDEYRRKRDFAKTPEPAADTPVPAAPALRFCFQKHDATNLHYDLRLEVDGVLASWAVPKGPTLDPNVKRLAMQTEDHPMMYLDFEGNIPKGNYGAGSMMLWDIGTYEVLGDASAREQLARGDFKFRLHGQRAEGEFALVKIKPSKTNKSSKQNEWLLIKKKDPAVRPGWEPETYLTSVKSGRTQEEIAADLPDVEQPGVQAPMPLPTDVCPMLATPVDTLPRGAGWVTELKWDGVRALLYLRNGRIDAYSRKQRAMTAQWPELADLPAQFRAETAVLDGEICVLDEQGRPSFEAIQPRIMARMPVADPPIVLYLFDLLYLDGRDLRQLSLVERKELLKQRLRPDARFRYSEHYEDRAKELLDFAKERGLEGILCKRANAAYEERRSGDWLKVKTHMALEAVICGYTAGDGDRAHSFGGLVLGLYREGELQYIGRVGSGFNQQSLRTVKDEVDRHLTERCPFRVVPEESKHATWAEPVLVCSVKAQGRNSTGILRAPIFQGLRFDVLPEECTEDSAGPPPALEAPVGLIPKTGKDATVEVDEQKLKLTNLPKLYYPEDNVTKRDVLDYYDRIAPVLLPHLKDRPISLRRYPDGIHGESFFQKNPDGKFPEWVVTPPLPEYDNQPTFICNSHAAVLYFANLGCIDHNPWQARMPNLSQPDFMLLDLDPMECPYEKIVEAAQLVRKILERVGLEGFPKTTGGDGMHIYVPLDPIYNYEQVRTFAEVIARIVAFDRPDLFTTPRAVARREPGRVYFDHLQIAAGKTISAPYVLRAYPGAPIATPLQWREVNKKLNPKQFHIRNMLDRVQRHGDLFSGVLEKRQRLESALPRLAEELGKRQE